MDVVTLADSLTQTGDFLDAENLLLPLLNQAIASKQLSFAVDMLIRLGINAEMAGRYQKSFEYLNFALRISEKNNYTDHLSEIFLNIGYVYFDLKQCRQAVDYYRKSIEVAAIRRDTLAMIKGLNNAGNAWMTIDNNADSALVYFEEGFRLSEKVDYSTGLLVIGGNVAQIYLLQEKYNLASAMIKQLLLISPENSYFLFTRAQIEKVDKKYFDAISDCRKAIVNTGSVEFRLALLKELSGLYISVGKSDSAFFYLSGFTTLTDSIHKAEINGDINKLEAQYQNEKKLRKIEQLEKDALLKQRRVREMTFLLIGVVVIALIIVFYYRNKRIIVAQKLEIEARKRTEIENESEIRVARSYIEGEETERERLACEIHDGLGGMLTGIRLQLNGLISDNNSVKVGELNLVASRIHDASAELRQMSRNLFPQTLVEYGLNAAFSELVESLKRQFLSPGLYYYFSGSEFRYDALVEKQLFRTVQELVNNALKHAVAKRISIELVTGPDRIWIAVSDDGTGFDKAVAVKGIGLRSVAERISSLNGKLEMVSLPGEGTHVTIELEIERLDV